MLAGHKALMHPRSALRSPEIPGPAEKGPGRTATGPHLSGEGGEMLSRFWRLLPWLHPSRWQLTGRERSTLATLRVKVAVRVQVQGLQYEISWRRRRSRTKL